MEFTYDGRTLGAKHVAVLEILRAQETGKTMKAREIEVSVRQDYPALDNVNATALLRVLVQYGLVERSEFKVNDWQRRSRSTSQVYTYWISADGEAASDAYTIWLRDADRDTGAEVATLQPGSVSAKDRTELRRLLARRKSVLTAQLNQRQADIETLIRNRVADEGKAAAAEHNAKVLKFNEEARLLEEKWEAIKAEAQERGLKFHREGYGSDAKCEATVSGSFGYEDVDKRVRLEMAKLRAERAGAAVSIEERFMRLEEELILDTITSEGGRTFLEKVPDVDSFLPSLEEAADMLELERSVTS